MKGVELEALNLFRAFSGLDGPASEFEFRTQGNKVRWMKLVCHILLASLSLSFKDPIN